MSFGGGDDSGHATTGHQGTRTRLPESEGGARPTPMRPGKSMLVVVGVVMLLIGAIAFATRGEESDGGRGDDAKGEQAQPTAPTGEKPVGGRGEGIPSGFAQSRQGAESAAANFAVALGGDQMFAKDSRHAIVDSIYTQAAATKLKPPQDKAYSPDFLERLGLDAGGNAPSGMSFISRTIPVGTKATDYSSDQATVEVWYTGLIGMAGTDSEDPVRTDWKTWTFELQWDQGDWKIVKDTQKNGPAPVPGDTRASGSDEINEAVEEYGGFTYAR